MEAIVPIQLQALERKTERAYKHQEKALVRTDV